MLFEAANRAGWTRSDHGLTTRHQRDIRHFDLGPGLLAVPVVDAQVAIGIWPRAVAAEPTRARATLRADTDLVLVPVTV
jgi:hypothetical protein